LIGEERKSLLADMTKVGVVIPTYNASHAIGSMIRSLLNFGFRRNNIIVVDDGSSDSTRDVVSGLGVELVTHRDNKGKGAALKSGFEYARKRCMKGVFTVDADGQHLVSEIERFMDFKKEVDLLVGVRGNRDSMPFLRTVTNAVTSLVMSVLANQRIPDVQCGFRYVNLSIFDKMQLNTSHYETESEIVFKAIRHNYRIGFQMVTTVYAGEKSYIRPLIDTVRFVVMALRCLWR
jgi:glycosyltransferase involved in cell wall biosynthesis